MNSGRILSNTQQHRPDGPPTQSKTGSVHPSNIYLLQNEGQVRQPTDTIAHQPKRNNEVKDREAKEQSQLNSRSQESFNPIGISPE